MGKTKSEEAEVVEEATLPPVDDAATLPDPAEPEEETLPEDKPVEDFSDELVEEEPTLNADAKQVLEATYPVLREHGSHNAAMKGLQTSPGYDPTKL